MIGAAGGREATAVRAEVAILEALEPRTLLSFSWSADEVYLAELVNRARANPQAEATRLGLNLSAGLTSAEQARLVAQQPLALNQYLTVAARAHSQDMATRNFFDHINPSGFNPTQRAGLAGYSGSAGENIAAGYANIDAAHRAWLESVGHRRNVLSLWSNFDNSYHYDEFGPGIGLGIGGTYNNYYTQEFGVRTGNTAYVLGVVYNDANGNQFYTVGEGRSGVRIDVASAANPRTPVATYTTDAAGNYQFDLAQGSYALTFTEVATGRTYGANVTLGSWNQKVDALLGQFSSVQVDDDHSNAGQWADASVITVSAAVGDGATGGLIASLGDSDLFRFTAPGPGQTRILLGGNVGWVRKVTVFDSAGVLIGTDSETVLNQYAQVDFNATQGATYFVLVEAGEPTDNGTYVLVVDGQPPAAVVPPGGGGGGGDDGGGGGSNPGPLPEPGPRPIEDSHLPLVGDGAGKANIGADPSGRVVVTYLNAAGKPTYAVRDADGSWTTTVLSDVFDAASFTGEVVNYVDANTGEQFVGVRANLGIVLYRLVDGERWVGLNVVKRTAGSTNIGGDITILFDRAGLVTITGLTKTGKVVLWQQLRNGLSNGNPRFYFRNVSDRDLAPIGLATRFDAGLTAWTTPRGTLNIAAVDGQGRIRMFWRTSNTEWTGINLSNFVATPAVIVGDLTAFQTPGRGITIVGNDASGGTHTIRWRANSGWMYRGITAIGGETTLLQSGGTSAYLMPGAPAYVASIDLDGNLAMFRYRFGNDTWSKAGVGLSELPVLSGYAATYFDSTTNQTFIVSRSIGGEFQLVMIGADGVWSTQNLSALLAA